LFEFRREVQQSVSFIVSKERRESAFHALLGRPYYVEDVAVEQDILLYLVTQFGDMEHLGHTDRAGVTPLQIAALTGRAHAVSILVNAGSDVNYVSKVPRSGYFGMTALDIAFYSLKNPPYISAPEKMLHQHGLNIAQTIQVLRMKGAMGRTELLPEFERQYSTFRPKVHVTRMNVLTSAGNSPLKASIACLSNPLMVSRECSYRDTV
jgi:hypothetical protein